SPSRRPGSCRHLQPHLAHALSDAIDLRHELGVLQAPCRAQRLVAQVLVGHAAATEQPAGLTERFEDVDRGHPDNAGTQALEALVGGFVLVVDPVAGVRLVDDLAGAVARRAVLELDAVGVAEEFGLAGHLRLLAPSADLAGVMGRWSGLNTTFRRESTGCLSLGPARTKKPRRRGAIGSCGRTSLTLGRMRTLRSGRE